MVWSFYLVHFCKNLGNLPNVECLQMFRSPLGCSTATTLEYALAFYVSSKSSMWRKILYPLKLSQENRNYLFESLSFRCYQLSMMAHFTLRELMSLKSQRERNHCLTCQHRFKLYAWYSCEISGSVASQTQPFWIYEIWQKHSLSGISANYYCEFQDINVSDFHLFHYVTYFIWFPVSKMDVLVLNLK